MRARTTADGSGLAARAAGALQVTRLLEALCRRHERAETRVYRLAGRRFRHACLALRRFWFLRDRLRLRLHDLRTGALEPSEEDLRSDLLGLTRASGRLERLLDGSRDQTGINPRSRNDT
jgi:hypothetical protein